MGVEYRHFLVVKDLSWIPSLDTAERVGSVLRKWQLIANECEINDLSQGNPGGAVLYTWNTDETESAAIGRIAGPSMFDEEGEPVSRYMQSLRLLCGTDFHCHPSSELAYIEVEKGPFVDGQEIRVDETMSDRSSYFTHDTFPGSGNGEPPKTKVEFGEANNPEAMKSFTGVWRAAIAMDFGKDLAVFMTEEYALPEPIFVADLSDAFRAELLEVGEFY
jgi:hypothetical protein